MSSHDFFPLPVCQVIQETDSAVSVVFDVPDEQSEIFRYKSGQFLTLRIEIEGKFRHRCYSLSSAPGIDAKHKVTIKQIDRGLVSTYVCSSIQAGNTILVQPPAGHFVPASLDGDFLLIAGGSGITPVLSILKSALAHGKGRIVLLYANRDENSVIFSDELKKISLDYPERFLPLHWIESVQGLPHAKLLAALLRPWAKFETFICGPELFMVAAQEALAALGAEPNHIHVERFVSLPDEDATPVVVEPTGRPDTHLTVLLDGEEHELAWPSNAKMLDTMLEKGLDAPYSCRVGGCSACMCRVLGGKVRMAQNVILDEREIAEGWVLACQAYPEADNVKVEIP